MTIALSTFDPDANAVLRRSGDDRLAPMLRRAARLLSITSERAPNLVCVGAEIALSLEEQAAFGMTRVSATGASDALAPALASCLAEAAELVSAVERPGDVVDAICENVPSGWIGRALSSAGFAPDQVDWLHGVDAASGKAAMLPADLCLRRAPDRPRLSPVGALSAGCAAGRTREAAALRAILELIERDAAALWWLGGRPPQKPRRAVVDSGERCLARLRAGASGRQTAILEIASDFGISTIAAASWNEVDGTDLACGLAARLDPLDAARAAVVEMCQMELAAPLAAARARERGTAALTAADRRHLERAALDARRCALLHGSEHGSERSRHAAAPSFRAASARALARRLEREGARVFLVDLTRQDVGAPVMRAVSPDLQPFASDVVTRRFEERLDSHGGGAAHTQGVPLF